MNEDINRSQEENRILEKIAQLKAERKEIEKRNDRRRAAYKKDSDRCHKIDKEIQRLQYVALIGVTDAVRLVDRSFMTFIDPSKGFNELGTLKAVHRTRCRIQTTADGKIWDAPLASIELASQEVMTLVLKQDATDWF